MDGNFRSVSALFQNRNELAPVNEADKTGGAVVGRNHIATMKSMSMAFMASADDA